MNRLLIQSNGTTEGYASSSLAHPSTSTVNGSSSVEGSAGPSGSNNDVRRLQDEVNQLTKRNGGTHPSIKFSVLTYLCINVFLFFLFTPRRIGGNSFMIVELMQQLARAEQHAKEMSAVMKKDFELSEGEKSQKIKDMEKSQRQWKQEKDELLRVSTMSTCFFFCCVCVLYNVRFRDRILPTLKKNCDYSPRN